jgi:putative hydrolase of the HAD superfamily
MIKNIVFDFGDIFINLDKLAVYKHLEKFGFKYVSPELDSLAKNYEMGLISSSDFVLALKEMFPTANEDEIIAAWNSILLDFPIERLEFIEQLAAEKKYRLFLLSNTNELHIDCVIKSMGTANFNRFKSCFEQFYLSHEINLRKPNTDIYAYVLGKNQLKSEETLFIDDMPENTKAAEGLGIKTWNLLLEKEDIIQLFSKL